MPNDPEVKQPTPPGDNLANAPKQEAPKVKNSPNALTDAEQAGKVEVDKVIQKLTKKKDEANEQVKKIRQENSESGQNGQLQKQIEEIVNNPASDDVKFLFKDGHLPINTDLQLVLFHIAKDLQAHKDILKGEHAIRTLESYKFLIEAAEKGKADDIRAEFQPYKERIVDQMFTIAQEVAKANAEYLYSDGKKREAFNTDVQKAMTEWRSDLVEGNIDAETVVRDVVLGLDKEAVEKRGHVRTVVNRSARKVVSTTSDTDAVLSEIERANERIRNSEDEDDEKDSHRAILARAAGPGGPGGGGRRYGGGGAGGPGGPGGPGGGAATWEVFSATDPRFARLPRDIQNLITAVNETADKAPRALTTHYLEGVVSQLDRLGTAVARPIIQEMKANIDTQMSVTETTDASRRENENIKRELVQNERRFEQSLLAQRGYEELGYNNHDAFFLDYILGDPANAEKFIKGENFGDMLLSVQNQLATGAGQDIRAIAGGPDKFAYMNFGTKRGDYAGNYKLFKMNVRKVFDHLFDAAALKRLEEFDKTQDMMVHRPIENKIYSSLQTLARYFSDPTHNVVVGEVVKYDYSNALIDPRTRAPILDAHGNPVVIGPNRVHTDLNVELGEAIGLFSSRLNKEADLRAYNHDIGVVLGKKLSVEQLAGFAQRLDAGQVDVLFLEDELLQTAYRFYIQELKKMSADNFWMMGTTWLSEDPQGKVEIEENVKNTLRQLDASLLERDPTRLALTDRDLNRIISMASGMAFGITGEGFDILAQNQPPNRDGHRGFAGYFADNILPYWNIQHNFQRWGVPNHIPELMYIKIMKGGQMGKTWNYNQLKTAMEHDRNLLKTGLTWSLSGGPPMIDVASRMFGVKGLLGRGGWRILALTSHHLVAKDDGHGNPLPIMTEPYNPAWNSEEAEKWSIDKLIAQNIDWDKSFKNLEKAGVGVMFSYWIDKRVAAESHGHGHGHGHGDDPLKVRYYKEYLEKTRTRNPLIFLRYDLSQRFQDSLRYKALRHMPAEFVRGRDNYESIKGKIDNIERDLYLVVDQITRDEQWSVRPTDWNVIKDVDPVKQAQRRDLAQKYWEALQTEISGRGHGTIDEIYDKFFKEDARYYFFGSEDINFQELAFREGGFDILKRAYGDVNALSKGVEAFFKYPDVLKAAASGRDYGKIIEAIHEICHPIEGIHGTETAEQMTYYLVTMAARFFGKNTIARLPFGIGTMIGWFGKDSLSEAVFGKNAWSWDENKTAEFIQSVASHTGLIPEKGSHWFNQKNLAAEVGARNWQAVYDILRSALPLIFFIIFWQAIQNETKDSGGGGGGGGHGGGHH